MKTAFAVVVALFLAVWLAATWRGWMQLVYMGGIIGLIYLSCLEAKQRRWLNEADNREGEAHGPAKS